MDPRRRVVARAARVFAVSCVAWLHVAASGCSDESESPDAGEAIRPGSSDDDSDGGMMGGASPVGQACTRKSLENTIDDYYAALASHDPSGLATDANVKYTENGERLEIGQGFWQNAGALKFKRSVLDTETCSSVSESVVVDGSDGDGVDRVYGLRLKSDAGLVTEIETIIAYPGDYPFGPEPQAIIDSASDDWETVLAADERATRGRLTELIDRYFKLFPRGACGFMQGCERLENGFAPPGYDCDDLLSCDMDTDITDIDGTMKPRLHVIDVEAGVAVGFTMFMAFTDFHMFKFRDRQVVGVHAILASAPGSGWD